MIRQIGSMEEYMSFLKKEEQKVRRELRCMPRGCLAIQMKGKKPEYLKVTYGSDRKRKRTMINRDMVLVYKLAHKAYLKEKQKRLEHDISVCKKLINNWSSLDESSILKELPKHFELLDADSIIDLSDIADRGFRPNPVNDGSVGPINAALDIGAMDIDTWGVRPYCSNTKFEESKIHRSSNGLWCRSKGEVALIELCSRLGYRYHYDETVKLCGKLRSPDLIIARRDGSLVYLEHRGWKGDDYEKANMEKDRLYFYAGIRQGRNYLITFESDDGGLDVELVEMQLRGIVGN